MHIDGVAQLLEQVAQLGVRREGQRVLAFRAVQRDKANAVLDLNLGQLTEEICAPLERRPSGTFWAALALSVTALGLGVGMVAYQIATGVVHSATEATSPAAPFQAVFLFFTVTTAIGLAVYLLSQDRTD